MVYVIAQDGRPLMPTERYGKVRHMIQDGRAEVIRREPYTIQLTYGTGAERTQPGTLGFDSASKHGGFAVVNEKKTLIAGEFDLRDDVHENVDERRGYRRGRRYRNVRFREARFDYRKRIDGWLTPTMRVKTSNQEDLIDTLCSLVPVNDIRIEKAPFDTQKIKKPDIKGKEYQEGPAKGLDGNNKAYVRVRDNYTCWNCKTQTTDGEAHHLIPVSEGGPTVPENMVYLCKECHHKVTIGELVLNLKGFEGYKDMSLVNVASAIVLKRAIRKYGEDRVEATFGYITNEMRNRLGLKKEHWIDAWCIAGKPDAEMPKDIYIIRKVRSHNRKLHRGNPKKGGVRKRNVLENRSVKGFQRFDTIEYNGITCYIHGMRESGYFDIRTLNGEKVHASAKYSDLRLIKHASTTLIERRPVSSVRTSLTVSTGDTL